jgi:hypothetical protein
MVVKIVGVVVNMVMVTIMTTMTIRIDEREIRVVYRWAVES